MTIQSAATPIHLHRETPLLNVPEGYVGPLTLPGNNRTVFWTGRVAIGLRHQPPQFSAVPGQSALWIQDLLLAA
jgi:hypothetical protein